MTPTLSSPPAQPFLQPQDGIFELPGTPPTWIWACTCPVQNCDCRGAVVLASQDGRAALLERIAPVYEVWTQPGGDYRAAAGKVEDLVGFEIGINDARVCALPGIGPSVLLDLSQHPAIAAVAARIDGTLLDQFDELWHYGKGFPAAADQPLRVDPSGQPDYDPDALLAWTDVCTARSDIYWLGQQCFCRFDMYCSNPACHCDEVLIVFQEIDSPHPKDAGTVMVALSGQAKLQPQKAGDPRLAQLWAAFQHRYPDCIALLKERYQKIKELGATLIKAPLRVPVKPGRNDPCPCGSGKKYKKCCGATQ